ncbi:MAG: hypothetical protein IT221_16185, partial [Fluviicola sp.]|nr:hypothetical protein [Fluviicola sp.]
MRKLYNLRLMMLFIIAFVFSGSRLFGQIDVTATAGTPTASYTTLNSAFAAINAGTHQGVIDIAVVGNTTEPATPTPLVASNGTTVIYSAITIKPSGGNWVINSNAAPTASRGVIELNGADNVTIDGDDLGTPGSQNLTVQVAALGTTGLAAIRLASTSTTGTDGANNVTVRNLNIIGSRNSATSTTVNYGIVMSNSSAITTGAYSSLNTLIENNVISRCYRGIFANGASITYPNTGLIIRNNVIGTAVALTNVGGTGILVSYTGTNATNAALIEGNDIRVGDVNPTGTGFSASISGIELGAGSQFVKVSKNNIHDVMQPSTSGWGSFGINLTSATSSNNISITNNFIWNIYGSRYTITALSGFVPYGIRFSAASTGHEVINNTIQIPNSTNGTIANYVNYGVSFASGATVSKFLNNIIVNNNIGTGTFGVYCAANSALSSGNVNNNDYFIPSGNIGYYAGANQATIGSWKTATGMDASSWNVAPNFVSVSDLHIQNGGPASLLESTGATTALTNITTDFDNQTRPGPVGSVNGGATNPDIGADEFDGVPAPVPVVTFGSATPALTTQCATTDPRLISMNVTTPSGLITTVMLNYSFNGVAQTPISMVNTSGSTYEATIPAATPLNATVTWNVVATNDASIVTTFNGTAYQDQTLLGVSALATASLGTVCENTASSVSVSLTSTEPSTAYTTPSIANPTIDEDLGSVVITQGAATILSNTTTGGSLVGTIGTATGTAGSFSNFTNFGPYAMTAGQTYNFSLTSITQGGNFGNSMAIFIDLNRNGSFADAGEAVYLPAATVTGPHTETGSFTIPLTALNGKTRMRVYCLETLIASAASTASWGEYEDYMLNISSTNIGGGFSPAITSATWSDGSTTLGTGNPFTVNPPANTTYTATVLSLGCTVTSSTTTVNTIPLPSAPTATNSTQCGAQVPTASVASTAGVSGNGQFYWYDAAAAGNIIQTPPTSPYTTFYTNDFANTTIGAGASLNGVASLTNVPGQLELTPNATSQLGGITVDAGVNALAYKVDFDFSTTPVGGADGFSYSFADDVNAASTSPTAEMGSGTKFKVSFDAYGAMPNGAGIYLLYNNTATSFNATSPGVLGYIANTSWVGTSNNHVTIETNPQGQVTLTLNGTPLFTNVQLPAGYLSANKATWKHAIAARTGGIAMQQTFDNLLIQTANYAAGNTTYGTVVPSTSTFYVSEVGTNGCYSNRTPITVTVLTPAAINSAISTSLGCINDSIILTANSAAIPPYTYSWTANTATGSGISAPIPGDSIVVVPTIGGSYSYYVTGTNGTCTAVDTLTITIDELIPFDPTVSSNVLNLCNGDLTGMVNASVISMVPGTITTTTAGGNGCGGGAMFNITSNAQPITITSIEAVSNATSAQNVNVYYKAGTYVGSETTAGAWTLIGTYPINFTAGTLATIDIADLAIPVNATTAFFVNYSAQYTTLATTYTNADLTVTTGAGLCSAFGGVNNGRT